MGIPLSHVFWPALGGTPGQAAHGPHVHDPHDYPGLRPLNIRPRSYCLPTVPSHIELLLNV